MPRYFFQTGNGAVEHDVEGTELPDDDAARIEATRTLGQLIDLSPAEFWITGSLSMTVSDEAGMTLFVLDLTGAISPSAKAL